MRRMAFYCAALSVLAAAVTGCTYDSTPPGDAAINDSKPLLMLDATGFSGSRSVKLQYTDNAGSATQQTTAEKTDTTGRFLYPLYLTRGTRTYSLTITVDQNNDGIFGNTGDYSYATGTTTGISADTDIKNIKLTISSFTAL